MIAFLFMVVAILTPLAAAAQDDAAPAPILKVEFPDTEAMPGQTLRLAITVLVPTFMPQPPVWPSLEAPNLLVRLPERSTSPTSERIDAETWSGVTRTYRISPMVPGEYAIAPQDIVVTFRDPNSSDDLQATLTTDAITFTGVVPPGAEALDPFVAASDLTLAQTIEGTPEEMVAGDSLTRTVVATIDGVSPMFLPDLMRPTELTGVAAYPDEPVLAETDNRGLLTGTRTETVTYVAEGGGGGTLPEITLDWFDIDDNRVKTASVGSVELTVDGPPASPGDAPTDWRPLALTIIAGIFGLAALSLLASRVAPIVARRIRVRRDAHRASERYAWRALRAVLAREDYAALGPALSMWVERMDGADPRREPGVENALLGLGRARYGASSTGADRTMWRDLSEALVRARTAARVRVEQSRLPPLNPGSAR